MQNSNAKYKNDICSRCYIFSLETIALAGRLPNFGVNRIVSDQLIRSATSVGANLVEGKSSSSRKELKKYYEISLKSANETKYWLGILRDAKLADRNNVTRLLKEIGEISNMIAMGVINLKKKL